jgi:protein N-terminal amidase
LDIGYNFPSSKGIAPYIESPRNGKSAQWARSTAKRLQCIVCVGYPESTSISEPSETQSIEGVNNTTERYYNSVIVANQSGDSLFNYRKRFLYYTDDTWAMEGDIEWGGLSLPIGTETSIPTSIGVCMDINPYKFEAPYTEYEFASHVLENGSRLVILPMSWLTMLTKSELESTSSSPDMDTFNYWIQRFWPLISGKKGGSGDSGGNDATRETVLVFANRVGEELGGETESHFTARYAGTSTIITIRRRGLEVDAVLSSGRKKDDLAGTEILLWDILGRAREGVCVADTSKQPKSVFKIRRRSSASDDSSDGH